MREDIEYLARTYGSHPALYRDPKRQGKTLVYIYDSYLSPPEEWAAVLQPTGAHSMRSVWEADYIALVLGSSDLNAVERAEFDGVYTYFAATGFTHFSTPHNWRELKEWCTAHRKLFIPCVGPG